MWLMFVAVLLQTASAPVRSIDRGAQSGIDEARQAVVRTAAEWDTLWRAHAADRPRPSIDFAKEMVVGVFLGSRPTAGYTVEIVGVREEGGALIVQYREGVPPSGSMTAQILTMPYAIGAVPARPGEVRFEKRP